MIFSLPIQPKILRVEGILADEFCCGSEVKNPTEIDDLSILSQSEERTDSREMRTLRVPDSKASIVDVSTTTLVNAHD